MGIVIAVLAIAVSLINASWLAPKPKGKLLLVAHGGVAQQSSHQELGRDACTATRIKPPEHLYIANTVPAIKQAYYVRANAVEVDVQQTKDGQSVAFQDARLECRTNGTGRVRDHSLAELKALDVGYGYTADGGKTYPLRGRVGAMATVEEVLQAVSGQQLIFHFKTRDLSDADALAAAFKRAGTPLDDKIAFHGPEQVLARMRVLAPQSSVWSLAASKTCLADYLKWGWTGFTPESCRGATVAVPLGYQWALWGWPNRFLDRMAKVNARVILAGDFNNKGAPLGIERPEQLADVPRDFRGYLWVEDIYNVGRALQR